MAESKSKRKNGKKRAPQRKAPPKAPTKAEIQEAEQEVKKNKKMTYLGLISVAVMLVGQFCGQIGAFVGYPVAFVGSILGIWTSRSQQKGRTMTMVCYTIFAVLVAYSWFFQIINR